MSRQISSVLFAFAIVLTLPQVALGQSLHGKWRTTFGQEAPPFTREEPQPEVVEVEGEPRLVPNFQLSPREPQLLERLYRNRTGFLQGFGDLWLWSPSAYVQNGLAPLEGTPNPLPLLEGLNPAPVPFNYRLAQPHLAFFCRLEINETLNNVIPVRFRLGGHRYWQDEL